MTPDKAWAGATELERAIKRIKILTSLEGGAAELEGSVQMSPARGAG